MKTPHYGALEAASPKHAELDSKTASLWLAEAEVYSRLKVVDQRLRELQASFPEKKPGEGVLAANSARDQI